MHPVRLAEATVCDSLDDVLKSFSYLKFHGQPRSDATDCTNFFSRETVLGAREWIRANEIHRLSFSLTRPTVLGIKGTTYPGYLMPSDLSLENVQVAFKGQPLIQVLISFIPPRVFGLAMPPSRQAAAAPAAAAPN